MKNNFEKIKQLALYLIENNNINSPMKIQKLLFFARVEEIKNNKGNLKSKIFNDNYNFESWIRGPVIREVYRELKPKFLGFSEEYETEDDIWDRKYEGDFKMYENFLIKKGYINKPANELSDLSHENRGWKLARGNKKEDEISKTKIDENNIWN